MGHAKLLLVSASPRRRALIERLGLAVELASGDVDERVRSGEGAVAAARRLALAKVRTAPTAGLRVAGDTVVVSPDGQRILGKPADVGEAEAMLRELRGRTHSVVTGVAVVCGDLELVAHSETRVTMRRFTDGELDAYVRSGSPLDKAGAYGIQDEWFLPVACLAGCYWNVVGLPLCLVARLLTEAGVVLPPSPYRERTCDCGDEARLHQSGDLHPAG